MDITVKLADTELHSVIGAVNLRISVLEDRLTTPGMRHDIVKAELTNLQNAWNKIMEAREKAEKAANRKPRKVASPAFKSATELAEETD